MAVAAEPAGPAAATAAPVAGGITAPRAVAVVETPALVEPAAPPPEEEPKAEEPAAEKPKAAAKSQSQPAQEPTMPDASDAILTGRNYAIMLLVIGGGFGYLYWRHRQRQLELAATSVSHTPFSAPPTVRNGTLFSPELLTKLEWKRFEELVASYYSKTGVVASRTKSGPASPVNIRISWKGESRPFACVKCIAHPVGLVDAKPLQELVAVLGAEDIRRGYVVTTGKFSVNSRDLAEEKHLTLLPGDLFLEKLNALPEAARIELMQQTTKGDYTTPTCPQCEAKMVRSAENPSMWRCSTHPDQQIADWA